MLHALALEPRNLHGRFSRGQTLCVRIDEVRCDLRLTQVANDVVGVHAVLRDDAPG